MQNTPNLTLFPNSAELTIPVVRRRRSNFLRLGLFFLILASGNLAAQQGQNLPGDPFFLTLGRTPIPPGPGTSVTFYYELKIQQTSGGPYNFSAFTVVTNPTTSVATYNDKDLATSIVNNLNADPIISAEYTCTLEQPGAPNGSYWQVLCLPNPGRTPTVIKDTVDVRDAPDMIMSAGTWQADANITFEIDGTPGTPCTPSPQPPQCPSAEEVFLGVDGFVLDTPTAIGGVPKTLTQIRLELLMQLLTLGFSNAFIDPTTNLLNVPSDPDGNPPIGDWGGTIFTTDPGLIVTSQMTNTNAAVPRPPRGTVNAPPTAMAGATITVSISGFPMMATVNITVNGQAVGTIMTGATTRGSTMVTLPAGPKGIPLEIRASGGTPITFGYAWITLN